jgi:hypothetical protein
MPGSRFETINERKRREAQEWRDFELAYRRNPPQLKPRLCGNCDTNPLRSPVENLCEPCATGRPVVMPSSAATKEDTRASA